MFLCINLNGQDRFYIIVIHNFLQQFENVLLYRQMANLSMTYHCWMQSHHITSQSEIVMKGRDEEGEKFPKLL